MSATKHLRLAGLLQIILGVGSIVAVRMLLGSEADISMSEAAAESALFGIIGIYAVNIFKVIAGIIGICLANKKSLLTVILGIVLFFAQLIPFLQIKGDIVLIIVHIVLLVIPYYYLHNAYKNFRR